MVTVISDIWYCVRLVQLPRPGISCAAGDPGVGFGQLYADCVGIGTVSMQTPVMQVAAGAGCRSRALGTSNQLTRDFRTSDYVAAI
jgi:hypothetical protein